jgi:asparagine synthase (glutamine-hydrolysing)
MYPYVAFVHNVRSGRDDATAHSLKNRFRVSHPQWQLLDGGKNLSVFHLPPPGRYVAAIELPAGGGAILGTLFPSDIEASPRDGMPAIDAKLAAEIVRTGGRYLVENYWGGYIAFLNDRGTTWRVLRDSSGKIPCYTITHGDVTLLASNIGDLAGLALPAFSMNASYLAGFIYAVEICRRECALKEVSEVLAGECLELNAGRTRQFAMWDPRSVCRDFAIEDFDDACRQVRRVTQSCVNDWASRYDRIVHRLSGGLDSSVVLGCLKNSPKRPEITCVHLESGGLDDQERAFAQLAADAAGVELVVQSGYSSHATYDDRLFHLPKMPNPSVASVGMAVDPAVLNLVPEQVNAEAVWDGEGGDHLFFAPRSPFGAVDYAFRHGLGGGFFQSVHDAVRRSRLSYWEVLGKSVHLGALRGRWQPEDEYNRQATFVNPDVVPKNLGTYVWHPWSQDASDLPPGKRWQICLLACLVHRHRPVPELQHVSQHHPLFSQPLFELCLRIPLYVLLQGGVNRALERAAFRDCVPEPILRRENKGAVATILMSKIRESLPYLRDLVLGGVLVQERILVASDLEPYLIGNRPVSNRVLWPLLSSIAAEVWARKWASSEWRL